MINQKQSDEIIVFDAPYAVSSGEGALVGSMFGVAVTTLGNGVTGSFVTRGVFELKKVGSQAWTVGALIYWDNTNKYCTTTSSGNKLIGVATAAIGSGAGVVKGIVRLNGAFIS